MMEIERKILGIDVNAVTKRIFALKPKPEKVFEGLLRVKYFDFADGSIHKKHDLLRIREFVPEKGKPFTELVYKIYKGVKNKCKCFEELESIFFGKGRFKEFSKFLQDLGFKQTVYFEKKRTTFKYKKMKFEIDEYPGIPPMLEIEAGSALEINAAIKLLKLENHEQSALSIGALIRKKYPKFSLNRLTF